MSLLMAPEIIILCTAWVECGGVHMSEQADQLELTALDSLARAGGDIWAGRAGPRPLRCVATRTPSRRGAPSRRQMRVLAVEDVANTPLIDSTRPRGRRPPWTRAWQGCGPRPRASAAPIAAG